MGGLIDGTAVSSGVVTHMVDFVSAAWPIVVPIAALGLAGLVLLIVRGVTG